MLPDWLVQRLITGEVTKYQVFWGVAAFVTLLWTLQFVKPTIRWLRGYKANRKP